MANTDAYAEESVLSLEDNGEAGVGACLGNIAPMRPTGKAPLPMEVWRAHGAYLNVCRLTGGGLL